MAFTRLDRNLLARVTTHLKGAAGQADAKHRQATAAGNFAVAKVAKADADRLHRDARDLAALRGRLEAVYPEATKPIPEDPARG